MDVRDSLKKMRKFNRTGEFSNTIKEADKSSIRNQLNNMRKIFEAIDKASSSDTKSEIEKMNRYFSNENIVIDYEELELFPNFVFFGGTIDNSLQFVFKVTENEQTSGIELNFLEGYNPDNEENKKIIDKLEKYYEIFFNYWKENYLRNDQA